ncbi:MAG: ABC transporter ATP-binding protein [Polyangiales bacterium]
MSAARNQPSKKAFLLVDSQRESVDEAEQDTALLRRLAPYLRPQAKLLGLSLLLMPLASGAAALQPFFLKKGIDAAIVERSTAGLHRVVLGFAIAIALEFLARFAQTYTMQLAGQRATAALRSDLFDHVQRLRVGYFDRTPIGRVVTRLTNDIDALQELFASGAVTAIADILLLVAIVGFMFYLDAKLAAVTMLALPPLFVLVNAFRKQARRAFRGIRVHIAQLNAYLSEQVQGIAVVQAYGREAECQTEYRTINADHRDANFSAIRYDALLYSVVESISVACVAIVVWYASVEAGALPDPAAAATYVGTVVAFYDYIQKFFVPIRDLSTKYTVIQSSLAASERIFSLLDVSETDAPARAPEGRELPSDAAIAFEHVTFGYRPDLPVLSDVTFHVRRGERVAVVGATGSGKTTLTALLLRLYDHEQGTVAVDGADVRAFDREALRRKFACVPQDVFLFRGSVAENVALDLPIEPDKLRTALGRVGALAFLEPRGGLDALVEERGTNFSAGERQLLAFARALYRDAPYLVLDEATANVDSETEARLESAAGEVLAGRTAIVIAHRLATVRSADRIVVLHHGHLVEEGTHAELLARNGVYARLHRLQFAHG